jgi:asparaginyl-tRNA synthetase
MDYCNSLPLQISDIFNDYYDIMRFSSQQENSDISQNKFKYCKLWSIKGWVRDYRIQSENVFITIYDGSTSDSLQVICNLSNFTIDENLRGACIQVSGNVITSPAKGQDIEMVCNNISIIGNVSDKNSILHVKNIQLDTLRSYQHLRPRFKTFNYIYKIRSTLLKNIHNFFHNNKFYNLDPNIITTSDCEGAGEVFTITTLDPKDIKEIDEKNEKNKIDDKENNKTDIYSHDFFGKRAFLTVSSQLQLEALAAGLSRVYTLNPSFRAEKSKTKRHLACFTHLEWEIAFIEIEQLMDFSESLIKYVIKETLDNCNKEYEELNKFVSKGIIKKLENIINNNFVRISYDEAIKLIEENKDNIIKKSKIDNEKFVFPIWGDDLGSNCEKYICDEIYGKPVFVYNYPKDLKSFYMKLNDDGRTVGAVDLLIPQLGELIGSSIREDSYDKLIKRMDELKMDKSKLDWYIDLRKNSTFPHGGAGLGFDRLVNVCTLMDGNIREVVPFPVSYQECDY